MSDTIIMYENGKAVGGEGHPTNADEITFDNENTDLVSEEVESAIKEVNAKFDRGSVSVTADGVKTYSAILSEIANLIDVNKINANSTITIGDIVYHASLINRTVGFYFTNVTSGSGACLITLFKCIKNSISPSVVETTTITSASVTISTSDSSVIPTNGTVFKLEY